MTSKEFSLKIENIVKDKKISHMDGVNHYCEQNEIWAHSTVSNLVSKSLKEKIKLEATNFKMLKYQKCSQKLKYNMLEFDYKLDYKKVFRRNDTRYRMARGEQGVLLVEAYTDVICKHWRFKAVKEAKKIRTHL